MASKKRASKRPKKNTPEANELLVLELQEIHSAENQLARVLPRLAKAGQSQRLRTMLERRLDEGERLVQAIETALEDMEESPGRKKNIAAEGLIGDVREHVQEIAEGPALDAVLIAGIQKTEHYCIAAWGTAKALAQATEESTVVRVMESALEEGKQFDEELTALAEAEITPLLVGGDAADDESEDEDGKSGTRRRTGGNGGSERRSST